MTTYIVLFSLTDAGIKAAKAAPARRGQEAPGRHGWRDEAVLHGDGRLRLCRNLRGADDAVMARYVLQLGGPGFVRTKTLKAFPETAYREIIRSLV